MNFTLHREHARGHSMRKRWSSRGLPSYEWHPVVYLSAHGPKASIKASDVNSSHPASGKVMILQHFQCWLVMMVSGCWCWWWCWWWRWQWRWRFWCWCRCCCWWWWWWLTTTGWWCLAILAMAHVFFILAIIAVVGTMSYIRTSTSRRGSVASSGLLSTGQDKYRQSVQVAVSSNMQRHATTILCYWSGRKWYNPNKPPYVQPLVTWFPFKAATKSQGDTVAIADTCLANYSKIFQGYPKIIRTHFSVVIAISTKKWLNSKGWHCT